MKLITPSKDYSSSWQQAIQEFLDEGVDGFWNYPEKVSTIDKYLQDIEKMQKGLDLPNGFVPASTFWLIDKNKFIGHVNIRHELNKKLSKVGGHIGYAIRPTERRKGYGSRILTLVLPKTAELGIKKALITCYDDNLASAKIIEKNGGVFQDTNLAEGKIVKRYWVPITSRKFS